MSETTVINEYSFKNRNYLVCMEADELSGLTVSVEDTVTGEYWSGNFDVMYIENLTSKTGNFKQFNIFVAMLESALTQKSDAVIIHLLTFSDLEKLHAKKTGETFMDCVNKKLTANNKRYLILVYTVEFDIIHYPLPLNYQGSTSPITFQTIIRKLRDENEQLSSQIQNISLNKELPDLQKKYDELLQENEDLKQQLAQKPSKESLENKQTLKTIVKSLEQQLLSQKTRHQKIITQLGDKHKELLNELEDLKISERQLKLESKNLINEISIYKKCHLTAFPSVQTALAQRLMAQRVRPLTQKQRFSVYKWRPSSKCINCNNLPMPNSRYSYVDTAMPGRRSAASLERLPSGGQNMNYKNLAEWISYDEIPRVGFPQKTKADCCNLNTEDHGQLNPKGILKQKKNFNSQKSKSYPRLHLIDRDQVSQGLQHRCRTFSENGSNSGDSWQNLNEVELKDQARWRTQSKQEFSVKPQEENLKNVKRERKRTTKIDKLQSEPSDEAADGMERTLELSEIDARLNALQKLLEDNIP